MKCSFNDKQIELMKKAGINFNVKGNLSEDQQMEIDLVITDYLIEQGIDEDEKVNETGKLCEEILKIISE